MRSNPFTLVWFSSGQSHPIPNQASDANNRVNKISLWQPNGDARRAFVKTRLIALFRDSNSCPSIMDYRQRKICNWYYRCLSHNRIGLGLYGVGHIQDRPWRHGQTEPTDMANQKRETAGYNTVQLTKRQNSITPYGSVFSSNTWCAKPKKYNSNLPTDI